MYIINLGHDVCGNDYCHSQWIQTLPYGPPSDFDQQKIISVRFKFREEVFNVSYDEIVRRETDLMRQMLQIGFSKWADNMRQAWKEGKFNDEMQKDVNCLASLQQWDEMYGAIGGTSISESPKGTAVREEEEYMTDQAGTRGDIVNIYDARTPGPPRIDPTVEPFEPSTRRKSEPAMATLHEDIKTPVRCESVRELSSFEPVSLGARESCAVEIRHPDGPLILTPAANSPAKQSPVGTIGGHRPNFGRSPMRPRHPRGAFSVDQTIHEENEEAGSEEEIIMAGRPRRSTNAGF